MAFPTEIEFPDVGHSTAWIPKYDDITKAADLHAQTAMKDVKDVQVFDDANQASGCDLYLPCNLHLQLVQPDIIPEQT